MTTEDTNILHEKAKNRKDGVYSFHGHLWVVKSREFIAFADPFGQCYQRLGSFNVAIGKVDKHLRREHLLKLLK